MKKETNFNFSKLSNELSAELITVVNETIATDFVPVKNFTVVDLWNIQRKSRTTKYSRNLAAYL